MAGTKLIVDVDDVRQNMSLSDVPEINDAIVSGLSACHVAFAAILGTTFEEVLNQSDVFFLNPDLHAVQPNNQFRLRLKKAFVAPSSVAVRYAATRKDAVDATKATVMPATDYVLDADKGLLYIDAPQENDYRQTLSARFDQTDYPNKYFVVTYSAGFGDTTGLKAPEWLREAVLAWMPSVLIQKSDDVDKQIKTALNIRQSAVIMVEPYKRESAFNYTPIY